MGVCSRLLCSGVGVILMACTGNAQGEFRYSATYGTIVGEGNSIETLAEEARDSSILKLVDGQTLASGVTTQVQGQFIMRPGDRFVLSHAEWGRRFFYVNGECRWEDCSLEGGVWVDVGKDATGSWKNVTVRTGDAKGYPVVYFRSPDLVWDGGLVDCFPGQGEPAVTCVATREGYHPGPFTNTIRNVTFRSNRNFLVDRVKQRHDIDLTFENCVIETEGDRTADLRSNVKEADGCRTVITLKDCIRRHDGVDAPASSMVERGEIQLAGSGCTVRFVEGGGVVEVRQDGIMEVGEEDLKAVAATFEAVRRQLAELSVDERMRGSLCYARARYDDLDVYRKALEAVGWHSPSDKEWADGILEEIRDAAEKAPLSAELGSTYNPAPVPLELPPTGEASIEDLGDGRLRVRTWDSQWVYFSNPDGDEHATFTPESSVRGRPMFGGAQPGVGGPSVRMATPNESSVMLWEHAWNTRIAKDRGSIVGFEAELRTSDTLGTRATWVFFYGLPDVILLNSRSLQSPEEGAYYAAPTLRVQAYHAGARAYNGVRLWNDDAEGVRTNYAPIREHIDASEPDYGFFFGENPSWYYTNVTRGLAVAQRNGYNDWGRNPPCGYVFRASDYNAAWTGGPPSQYSQIVQVVRSIQPAGPHDLNDQILWFEGAGLKCWENVHNLERAFNSPAQPLLDLTGTGKGRALLWERDGLRRNVEIVILPAAYGALESDLDWYRGDVCVTLLRDVAAHAELWLGHLPVTCEKTGLGYAIDNGADDLPGVWVRLAADGPSDVKIDVVEAEELVSGHGWVAFRCTLHSGRTVVEVTAK